MFALAVGLMLKSYKQYCYYYIDPAKGVLIIEKLINELLIIFANYFYKFNKKFG